MSHRHSVNNEHTQKIADFVATLTYDAIPQDVRDRIKLLVLDSLGCGLYGANLEWAEILKNTLAEVDTTQQGSALWGTADQLSAPHAALVNGTQIQGFELDDVHRHGVLHVGAVTLPGLIAVAEREGMSGADFLTAAVAGYEIGPRVGIAMGQEHIGQGWHSGATVGVFSAAAGAAKGLSLSPEQTIHALGIAGTQSSGLMAAQYGAMVKRMHAGRAAQSGLYGALLAAKDFTGIIDIFESPYGGFCTTFSRSDDRFDLNALSAGLGEEFEALRISLKFYSCVGSNHTSLDAIRAIQERRPFAVDEIDKIVIYGSLVTADHVGWAYRPEGLTSAQLNLPFCVATLLLEGDVFVDQFKPEDVYDTKRIEISRLVEVREDPDITALGSKFRHKVRLEVHYRGGHVETETREAPRGSEFSFASEADILDKFRKLTDNVMASTQQQQLIDAVLGMEKLTDATDLTRLLQVQR